MKKRVLISLSLIFIIGCFISAFSDTASVNFFIEGPAIEILSPLNITYYFVSGNDYILDLNVSVSSSFTPQAWKYTLKNKTDNSIINDSIIFTPNSSISPIKGANLLIVCANDSSGREINTSVVFGIEEIKAPVIQGVNDTLYVCENSSMNYTFSVWNPDKDALTTLQIALPFYISPNSYSAGQELVYPKIISAILEKEDTRRVDNPYNRRIEVIDSSGLSDYKDVNIHVIEINNPPEVEIVGVRTIWLQGENSSLNETVSVNDIEDGNENSENISFTLSWENNENFFNITQNGIMNFSPNSSHLGTYNLTLCVKDNGTIYAPHPNISKCGQTGGAIEVCQNFSITITNENRAPTILDYYPDNYSLITNEGDKMYFNITKYDPDSTIPDARWYIDNILKEYDSGSLIDEFFYTFDYSSEGNHILSVNITDGLLEDFVIWNITVINTIPPSSPSSTDGGGGGGGGISPPRCQPLWVCDPWTQCRNLEKGLDNGDISGENYRNVLAKCSKNNLNELDCGFQTRICRDLNNCGTEQNKPEISKYCNYYENPDCKDNIKNCHHGSCELDIDCGGPCAPCPSCSDGVKNNGEEGIDCGGPCPWECVPQEPFSGKTIFWIIVAIALFFLLIVIIIKIIFLLLYKRREEKEKYSNS